MYYYMWEFFTSITIIILVIAYIAYDQVQQRKEKQGELQVDIKNPQSNKTGNDTR